MFHNLFIVLKVCGLILIIRSSFNPDFLIELIYFKLDANHFSLIEAKGK